MQKVGYLFNQDFTKFVLSEEHPMKPMRLKMVHSLISNYGLTSQLNMYFSKCATSEQMCGFHHPQYIKYLETWVSPKTQKIVQNYDSNSQIYMTRYSHDVKLGEVFKVNQGFDCPGFEGLYKYCQMSAGSSIDAADLIISGQADIAINWMGGFHHAKKTFASGFCYINDIVLCIIELLKVYPRVMYLDIDVHHGDGVQEAFYHTNRVMTVSFHQYETDFFPETGGINSVGQGIGKYFSINVPLKKGIDDLAYTQLFKQVLRRAVDSFGPSVIVIQCGADSLSKDKLGDLNLSIKGHGQCLSFMKSLGIPLILLGGGGYTIENVSRCWAYETGLMLGRQIQDKIPQKQQYSYFYQKDNNRIHFQIQKRQNTNSSVYLNSLLETITENLRSSQQRPSVPLHYVPTNQKSFRQDFGCQKMIQEEIQSNFKSRQ